jgi:hypothetical protein
MAGSKKGKPSPPPVSADRTSAVVTATLILLTALGVVTVFWEPLAALAMGAPATEARSEVEARGPGADGGPGGALDGSSSS